jgi:hypothetical protein
MFYVIRPMEQASHVIIRKVIENLPALPCPVRRIWQAAQLVRYRRSAHLDLGRQHTDAHLGIQQSRNDSYPAGTLKARTARQSYGFEFIQAHFLLNI